MHIDSIIHNLSKTCKDDILKTCIYVDDLLEAHLSDIRSNRKKPISNTYVIAYIDVMHKLLLSPSYSRYCNDTDLKLRVLNLLRKVLEFLTIDKSPSTIDTLKSFTPLVTTVYGTHKEYFGTLPEVTIVFSRVYYLLNIFNVSIYLFITN